MEKLNCVSFVTFLSHNITELVYRTQTVYDVLLYVLKVRRTLDVRRLAER